MWALWLAAPLVVIVLAAAAVWLRGRPARPLRTRQSIAGHQAYLDVLAANSELRTTGRPDALESDS